MLAGSQLLPNDQKSGGRSRTQRASKQRCPGTELRGRPGHHHQIADTAEPGHDRFDIAKLFRPRCKAAIEGRASWSGILVALSPGKKTVFGRRSRFQHLTLEHLAGDACGEDYVGNIGKGRIWIRKDKERANMAIELRRHGESSIEKRVARELCGRAGPGWCEL